MCIVYTRTVVECVQHRFWTGWIHQNTYLIANWVSFAVRDDLDYHKWQLFMMLWRFSFSLCRYLNGPDSMLVSATVENNAIAMARRLCWKKSFKFVYTICVRLNELKTYFPSENVFENDRSESVRAVPYWEIKSIFTIMLLVCSKREQ